MHINIKNKVIICNVIEIVKIFPLAMQEGIKELANLIWQQPLPTGFSPELLLVNVPKCATIIAVQ